MSARTKPILSTISTILLTCVFKDVKSEFEAKAKQLVAEEEFWGSHDSINVDDVKRIYTAISKVEQVASTVCDKMKDEDTGYQGYIIPETYILAFSYGDDVTVKSLGLIECRSPNGDQFFIAPSHVFEVFFVVKKINNAEKYHVLDMKLICKNKRESVKLRKIIEKELSYVNLPRMPNLRELSIEIQIKQEEVFESIPEIKAQISTAEDEFLISYRRNIQNVKIVYTVLSEVKEVINEVCNRMKGNSGFLKYQGIAKYEPYRVLFSSGDEEIIYFIGLIECQLKNEDCLVDEFVMAPSHLLEQFFLMKKINDDGYSNDIYRIIDVRYICDDDKDSAALRNIIGPGVQGIAFPEVPKLHEMKKDLQQRREELRKQRVAQPFPSNSKMVFGNV